MSQSIELHGPIHEYDGLAKKLRELKGVVMRRLSPSGVRAEQATEEQVFEIIKAEGDEVLGQLQKLGRINLASYGRINDILNAALKNPEEMVKVRLNVMRDGLQKKKEEDFTEEGWAKSATEALQSDDVKMWLNAHPTHKN